LRLTDNNFRHALLESGLDHVMIVLDVDSGQSWESVRDVLAEDIALTVHITISPENKDKILESLDTLSQMGILKVSLSISDQMLEENLKKAREKVADLNMALIWDLPVPYSAFNPVSLELRESLKLVDGSGKAWLYVEPDGDVLPAQGINKVIGNLLTESWENIWAKSQ
jgi:MoaA/NifB/PqqE/SkfB family radical SAM enzyme